MSSKLGRAALCIGLTVALAGCSGPRRAAPARATAAEPSVDLPPGCRAQRVADTVGAFLDDYSSGRPVSLDDHFTPVHEDRPAPHYYTRGFQWFADNGGPDPGGFQTYRPGRRLNDYIRGLQEAGDEQRLAQLYVNAYDPDRDWASFGLMIRRTRPGSESNVSLGKGAVRCRDLRITLWDLGPAGGGEDRPPLCDYDETTGDEAIVCTR